MHSSWPKIAIVGAGFGGIAAAQALRKAGFTDLTLFDRNPRPGGTWLANTYPGVECDVPSHLYSFSFRLNGGWSRKWSPQAEILAYLEDCVREEGLEARLRLKTEIASGEFDEQSGQWTLTEAGGARHRFDIVIFAVGQLNRPCVPSIDGLDDFEGPCFHSARWRHDVALDGKSVAVIGNAASAVQLVPRVARQASDLTIYQRSANWMLRKGNRRYRDVERALASRVPGVAWLYRAWIWLYAELLVYPLTGRSEFIRRLGEWLARRHLHEEVSDPELRAALTPDYPMGAKRILFADEYYGALVRDNVALETSPIRRVGADYVECADGRRRSTDVIVLATGFQTTDFLAPVQLRGRRGVALDEAWREAPQAYLGMSCAGFPNLFMLYGPNTNLGHSSIIMMLECQARYIAACLGHMRTTRSHCMEVRRDVQDRFNARIEERLARKVWARVSESWYLRNGRNTNNWPGSTLEYWWRTRRFRAADYRFERSERATAGGRQAV